MTKCLISFGANLPGPFGSPEETLRAVFNELPNHGLFINKKSSLYSSAAFPDPTEPRFLNGCLEILVDCDALTVLERLKRIELKMGRRENYRWGSRVCDLDLLSFENTICPSKEGFHRWYRMPLDQQIHKKPEELLLPHPRLQDRAFVLKPLMEFAADWIHPVLNYSIREMFESLTEYERKEVVLI